MEIGENWIKVFEDQDFEFTWITNHQILLIIQKNSCYQFYIEKRYFILILTAIMLKEKIHLSTDRFVLKIDLADEISFSDRKKRIWMNKWSFFQALITLGSIWRSAKKKKSFSIKIE